MMRPTAVVGALAAAAGGCRPSTTAATAPASDAQVDNPSARPDTKPALAPRTDATPPTCEVAPDWRYEKIDLPPAFAPTLPEGTETLWFAPGMMDPAADDYFTYAFELSLRDGQAGDVPALLVAYYQGLMDAVGASAGRTAGEVRASLEASAGGYRGTISMTNEFVDGRDMKVSIGVAVDGPCIRARATAKPSPANEALLARMDACLLCQGAAATDS